MDAVQKMATVETDKKDQPYAMIKYYYLRLRVGNGSFIFLYRASENLNLRKSHWHGERS